MYKVVGLKTNKVYVKSKDKAKCYRYLTRKYPYKYGYRGGSVKNVYTEPLMILGGENNHNTMQQAIVELTLTGKFMEK